MIEFVKKLPESYDAEFLMLENNFGLRYALVQIPEDPSKFRVIFEDFIINCDNVFLKRKIKAVFCEQWHGRKASEAPLFKEYLELLQRKENFYVNWCQNLVKDTFYYKGLPDLDKFHLGDIVTIPSQNAWEWELSEKTREGVWFVKMLEHEGTGTFAEDKLVFVRRGKRRLAEADETAMVPLEGDRFSPVLNQADVARGEWRELLAEFLGIHIAQLDKTQFKILQTAIKQFERPPQIGEVIMVYRSEEYTWRQRTAHTVVDYEFKKKGKVYVQAISIVDGKIRAFAIEELTLYPDGVWHRQMQGWGENAAYAAGWFKLPVWFGANWLSLWKQEVIMGFMRRNILPVAWLGMGRYNALMMTMITLIPMQFDTVWDWTVSGFLDPNYRETMAADITLPLGMRTYINAITGEVTNTEETNSLLGTISNFGGAVGDALGSGYNAVKGEIKGVVETTTETVTKIFYGIAGLGTIYIFAKLVD
jgi:hypothetical protein